MIQYVIFDVFETLVSLNNNNCASYFGIQIAQDLEIPWEEFCIPWRNTDYDRSCGKKTFEEVIKKLMHTFSCFTEEKYEAVVQKRYAHSRQSFTYMRKDILTMLSDLKQQGCKIGILSNCYFEERESIRGSVLLDYLDTAVLSCEVGMAKPEEAIFKLCMRKLWQEEGPVDPTRFLYVGDGGSEELETASRLGMVVRQATWFLQEEKRPSRRKTEFLSFENPSEVVEFCKICRM